MAQTPVRRPDPPSAPAHASFRCTRSPGRMGAAWIHLTGELDLAGAPAVAQQLREAQAFSYMVVVDLRELGSIDSAGLGVLVAADAEARLRKRSLVLIRGGGQVDRMLEQTGMLTELEVVDLRAHQPTDTPVLDTSLRPRGEHPQIQVAGRRPKAAPDLQSESEGDPFLEGFSRGTA